MWLLHIDQAISRTSCVNGESIQRIVNAELDDHLRAEHHKGTRQRPNGCSTPRIHFVATAANRNHACNYKEINDMMYIIADSF